jgi:3-oxoacyl-[acyl-carrier-protein] synthase II
MTRRRIAITGLGLITPLGIGIEPFWSGLMEGRSAVRPAARFDAGDMPTTHYAEIPEIDYTEYLDPQASALWSGVSKLAVTASILAMRDAGNPSPAAPRLGVILGTGYGAAADFQDVYDVYFRKGWRRIKPATVPKMMPNAPASLIGIHFGARGVNFTVSTACSSGAIAAGLACQQIRAGTIDACITGGADFILNHSSAAAWNNLRVLSRRNDPAASRPFSADRKGLVFGEGAGLFVLEEWEAAKARGARIYAEVVGVGATNDAVNIVGPALEGEAEAVTMALADAGLAPADIDYVCAHGTGTEMNDANESTMLKEVLGERARAIPVSSIKGHVGHTMGAAGAIEVAAAALAIERQRVPATLNFEPGDPACDLDYVADGPRDLALRHAMTNSFGFGGQNSVLVLRAPG